MKALVLLALLLGADGGVPFVSGSITITSSTPKYAFWNPSPDYWEDGPFGCTNGARPRAETRDGGTYLICDARRDGGR